MGIFNQNLHESHNNKGLSVKVNPIHMLPCQADSKIQDFRLAVKFSAIIHMMGQMLFRQFRQYSCDKPKAVPAIPAYGYRISSYILSYCYNDTNLETHFRGLQSLNSFLITAR